ncbi:MAG: CHASE2 domain-containing protein [Desulfobacteraceae bacterium]|nr:MAG: CHASE2 domain-containing protein [Desulfobacteraceae bacterium]
MMPFKKSIPGWSIGLILTLLFITMFVTGLGDFTDVIEKKTFDLRSRLSASGERNPDIEIVVIDDEDLAEIGRFPWPRNILAKAVHNLAMAGAKVIALDIMFNEPEESFGLKTIKELKKTYIDLDLKNKDSSAKTFYKLLNKAEADLDNDTKLAEAFKKAGNVVLPIYFDTRSAGRDDEVPDYIAKNSYKIIHGLKDEWATSSIMWLSKIKPLLPSFANSVAGIGHINLFPDDDGSTRTQIHAIGYLENTFVPSFPIAIVKTFKGLDYNQIRLILGEEIDIKVTPSKTVKIPATDFNMPTLIKWNEGPGVAFHMTPFRKVLKKEFQTSLFRDKIVILGPTAPGIGDRFVTPISSSLPGVEIIANSVSNILREKFFMRPQWTSFLELGIILLFGLYISFLLPRLKAGTGAIITLILLLSYGTVGTILFFRSNIWLKITPQLVLLILGYILVVSRNFFITERTKEKVEADSVETNKALGLSFQQQGMLDLAFEKFRKCPTDEPGVKDLLYNLGLDYERKRQFNKSLSTYNMIIEDGSDFKDLGERIPKLKGAETTMIFGTSAGHPGDIGTAINGLDTKPTLGRYEISGELGRGAMGIVYKGEDPTIHRTVAIKTLRLSEFEEGELTDIKERFFREAESAGLLNHPNIVSIYDAGEEHDLAYIAMEYLHGEDLVKYTHKGKLFPLRGVLNIITQVADALDYAHKNNVVHRDIKPANIMLLKDTDKIKVTDFGIARITSSSKTKTGVVLGTPSYMSPEQVSGKKLDGRSDIFSLGVVLFEMLTGQKPFVSEDMTSLMFQIAKEKHPSVRKINPKIPPIVEKIVDKALTKEINQRYQKASLMSEHLRKIIDRIDQLRMKKASKE